MLLSPRIAPRSASQCAAQKNSPRRRGRAQGSQAGLRELSGTTAMQSAGTVLAAQAILPVPQVARGAALKNARGSDDGVGLTSVGARHAVPGERTWRYRAICGG
jgi:hypothetical protein